MVIDTSALVAILRQESGAEGLLHRLTAAGLEEDVRRNPS